MTLNRYWSRVDQAKTLPGSHQSEDRFVRASYFIKRIGEDETDVRKQVAGVMSVLRNVSVPSGAPDPLHPNISATYWRTIIDHGRKVYYFESTRSAFTVGIDLKRIDFTPNSGIRSFALETEAGLNLSGDISEKFSPSKPMV